MVIPMPGVLRDVTHIRLLRVELSDAAIGVSFAAGAMVEGAFVEDPDLGVLSRAISGAEIALFREWSVEEEGTEDSPTYGPLVNVRSVMRFVGWREYYERLSEAEWDALLPTLLVFMDTEPPSFP